MTAVSAVEVAYQHDAGMIDKFGFQLSGLLSLTLIQM